MFIWVFMYGRRLVSCISKICISLEISLNKKKMKVNHPRRRGDRKVDFRKYKTKKGVSHLGGTNAVQKTPGEREIGG